MEAEWIWAGDENKDVANDTRCDGIGLFSPDLGNIQ